MPLCLMAKGVTVGIGFLFGWCRVRLTLCQIWHRVRRTHFLRWRRILRDLNAGFALLI